MLMMMMMQAGRPSPSPPSVFLVTLGFSCWRAAAAAAQSLPSPCLLHYNVREHSNRRFNGNIMQIVCSAVVPPPPAPLSIAHEYSFN